MKTKCKKKGCPILVEADRCLTHAQEFVLGERARAKRVRADAKKCKKCFLLGCDEDSCPWEPSIFANYKTPKRAAEEAARR